MHIFLRIKKQTLEQTDKQTHQPSLEAVTKSLGEVVKSLCPQRRQTSWEWGDIQRQAVCSHRTACSCWSPCFHAFSPSHIGARLVGYINSTSASLWGWTAWKDLLNSLERPMCGGGRFQSPDHQKILQGAIPDPVIRCHSHCGSDTYKAPGASWMNSSFITWSLLQMQNLDLSPALLNQSLHFY